MTHGSKSAGLALGLSTLERCRSCPPINVHGFRAEVISALKQLHSGVYRFPGGNFVSGHEWRDAIGDPDQRPPMMDPVWHAVQPNDVGTDELVELCRLLDVEPYVTVNGGFRRRLVRCATGRVCQWERLCTCGCARASTFFPQPSIERCLLLSYR